MDPALGPAALGLPVPSHRSHPTANASLATQSHSIFPQQSLKTKWKVWVFAHWHGWESPQILNQTCLKMHTQPWVSDVWEEHCFTFSLEHMDKTFCTFCMTFDGWAIFGTVLNKSDQTIYTLQIKVRQVKREKIILICKCQFQELNCLVVGVNFTGISFIYHGLKEAAQIPRKASPLLWFLAMHCLFILIQFHVVAWNSCQNFSDSSDWWITSYLCYSASSTSVSATSAFLHV